MWRNSLVITFVVIAFLGNVATFALFLTSDFWIQPFSAQATSEATLSLSIVSANATNDTGGGGSPGGGGSSGGGGGGSSGGVASSSVSFVVDPEELNLFIVAGGSEEHSVVVANTGRSTLVLNVSVSGIGSFVTLDRSTITLAPGESQELMFTIKAPDSGIYGGRISFSVGDERKDLILLLNVRSANALFDVSLTIPESLKVLRIGRVLKTFISLLQVGPAEDTDVTVTYLIKDFDGNTLLTETETFRVFRAKSYVKDFNTQGLAEGDYLVGVEVVYPQGFATSSAYFSVASHVFDYSLLALIVLLIISLLVLFYSFRTYRRAKQLRGSPGLRGKGTP